MSLIAIALAAATFTRTLDRVTTLDPVMAQSAYDLRAVKLVHETVLSVDYAARPYKLVPGACELPEVSADGLVYRLKLRCPELTSADVVRELTRLGDPANASPNGFVMKQVASVKAPDARTVEIRLKKRQHVFPWMLTLAGIAKADGSGVGPFVLSRWRRNHEMVFTRRTPKLSIEQSEQSNNHPNPFFHFPFGGTGSYPYLPKGWHLISRHSPSNTPLIAPCVFNASIMYTEQLGSNRQQSPKSGLNVTW